MPDNVVSIEINGSNIGDRAIIQLQSGRRIQRPLVRPYDSYLATLIAPTPAQQAAVFLNYLPSA